MERRPMRFLAGCLPLAPLAIVVTLLALTPERLLFIPASDVLLYERYGSQLLAGAIPNRDFAVEYPPLALLPMALPRLIWPFGDAGDLGYAWGFTLIEGTLACLTGWLIGRVSEHPIGALVTWVALVFASATQMAWRYDLWPAVLVLAALVAADRGRPGLAGAAIGAGVMLKLFPLVVLPILAARSIALREWSSLRRLLLGSAFVMGSVMASLATATVAVLVALLVTSKVFSVQYVVWFLPLVPLLAWPGRWIGLGIAALSTLIYPLNYGPLWQLDPTLIVILNFRNLVLVGLFVWLAADLARRRGSLTLRPDTGPNRCVGRPPAWLQRRA